MLIIASHLSCFVFIILLIIWLVRKRGTKNFVRTNNNIYLIIYTTTYYLVIFTEKDRLCLHKTRHSMVGHLCCTRINKIIIVLVAILNNNV